MNIEQIEEIETLIGTDVSIEECIRSGYTIIDTENKPFSKDQDYRIMEFYPDYILEEMDIENVDEVDRFEYMLNDTEYSFNELVEVYKKHEKGMNQSCETHIHVNFEEPEIYDFLNLASDCLAYCGL